ncbi:organic solute transporter Ostalpha-domain-containing protein [Aspergillus heterothallicus]
MGTAEFFHRRDGGKDSTACPMPSHLVPDASETFVGDLTFHHFNMILSAACTGVTCLVILTVMGRHAMHLSNSDQQVKIMRIATLFPLYTIYSFLSICFPNAYVYLVGWTKVFQGVALYWFLMLLCDFVTPNDQHRAEFFASLRIPKPFSRTDTRDGLSWLKSTWLFVLQYPIVTFILAIAQSITQAKGTYCLAGKKVYFAHLWITSIGVISLTMAMTSILRFHGILKSNMKEHKPMMKLLAFKMIVGLEFLEQIIFMVLDSTGTLKPSATMSYADTIIGLPTLIICLQVVPFAFLFYYAYSIKPYTTLKVESTTNPQYRVVVDSETRSPSVKGYQGGPLGIYAWLALFNPGELVRDINMTFNMFRDSKMEQTEAGIGLGPQM